MTLSRPARLDFCPHVCSDPPAWWLLKKKKTRDWTGGLDAHSTRIDLVNVLAPLNSAATIKGYSRNFADIHAYIFTLEPPKYPFPIDHQRAAQGETLFAQNCARCHGTYGAHWTYPNKVVSLAKIGTDPLLCQALTGRNVDYLNSTWLAREPGPDGKPIRVQMNKGYQAPPLDGIWATAPYFHNGSAPTVYDVLNSRARPTVFTRSYGTEKEDYDPVHLGLKITRLQGPVSGQLSPWEQRKIYDTKQPGRHNTGHTFGDDLTEAERMAIIEYLKTL
jgi:mono/diheme cytochrome c family protein